MISKPAAPKGSVEPMAAPTFITMGCRLNSYESDVMRAHAAAAGLSDAVIVNTCAVTAESVRKAVQTVRRAKRDQPAARIIVTGCAAQIEPERFAAMPEVDHVIGNDAKVQAVTFASLRAGDTQRVVVNDIMSVRETAGHAVDAFHGHTRAFVQVQNVQRWSQPFCIIPFGRGPSRSVPAGEVVAQVRRLVTGGYAEAVLTGVDITSYGHDLPGEMTLGRLVKQVLKHVPDLKRLRLSSIDQVEVDADLLAAIADEPRLMPHLHLSMQAGCDIILKRMKRRHSVADAVRFCNEARRLRPDVVFGADLIAGFPTESCDMFAKTLRLVDDCDLTYVHAFPFSPRPGTPAARMPQVAAAEIRLRAAQLRDKGAMTRRRYLHSQLGTTVEVLMENGGRGRTPQFAEVEVAQPPPQALAPATLQRVRVTSLCNDRLQAEVAP
jgi:threonylcarbamoyladenosine tRNA methylthiotransferase MtaB